MAMNQFVRNTIVILSILSIDRWTTTLQAQSLQEYMAQVRKSSLVLQSSNAEQEAALLKSREADLIFSPELFANGQMASDEKQSSFPGLDYDRIKTQNYSLGIKQDFSFGLNAKLYYAYDVLAYENVTPGNTEIKVYDARPVLELSIPLWQNVFGFQNRARADLLRQQSEAAKYAATAEKDGTLIQAEATYWRLAIARESVTIQEKALKQSESILAYVSKRAKMNLGEDADRLQAYALVEAKRFELKMAKNEERAASRAFNSLRQASLNTSIAELDVVPYDTLMTFTAPANRPGDRSDMKAAQAQLAISKLSAQMDREKNKPSLELFGSYAMNGRSQTDGSDAMEDSFGSSRTTNVVGVRFSMPLHVSAAYDAQSGAKLSEQAADLRIRQKQIEQDNEWNELVEMLQESIESLRLAKAIESAQQAKLLSERNRLKTGRTSTFQILQFEQEYSQSEFNRVKTAAQILALQTKLKLYSSQPNVGVEGK